MAGPALFNMRFFWWTYIISLIPQIFSDIIGYDSPNLLWIAVWTIGHLLATVVAIAFRYAFLDRMQAKNPNPFQNLAVASILGVIRVTSIGYISSLWGLHNQFDLGARIVAGLIFGVLLFGFLQNIFGSSQDYRDSLRSHLETRHRLQNLKRQAKENLKIKQAEVESVAQGVISTALEKITVALNQKALRPDAKEAVYQDIQSLLEGQVRPLSQSLRRSSEALSDPKRFRKVSRLNLLRLPKRVLPSLAIRPVLLLITYLSVVPFSMYLIAGINWVSVGQLLAILDFAAVVLAKYGLEKIGFVKLWLAAPILLVVSQLPTVIQFLALDHTSFPREGLILSTIWIALISFLTFGGFALVAVHENNRDHFLQELEKNNSKIERELALVNQKIWVERRQWALAIHGSVQASLTAALVRLRGNDELSNAELKKIRAHIAQARDGLVRPKLGNFDFKKAIKEIKQTWEGMVDVSFNSRTEGAKVLMADTWASVCANEIIKEAISNSMRHGSATEVTIECSIPEPGFVEIMVQDNGRGLKPKYRKGLGGQIIDEIAYPWSLENVKSGGVRLKARIAVASLKQPQN
ncbi:MAG: sensor histidine kinase [Actinomycetota bacterium]